MLQPMVVTKLAGWSVVPMGDNAPVARPEPGRFLMSADFSTLKSPRASWDFPVRMDLRREVGFSFDFYCSNILQCSSFKIYLSSGKGWYTANFDPETDGAWHRIVLRRGAFTKTEGLVAGWRNITCMRISGWRGGKGKVEMGIANLSFVEGADPRIAIVRADSCAANGRYRSVRRQIRKRLPLSVKPVPSIRTG